MALKADNSDLAKAPEGNPPDAEPRYGQLLAEAWHELTRERDHQKSRTDVDRYIRLGWGGKCARDIGYRLMGVEPSNPADLAGEWRMGLGTLVHEHLQAALVKAFPTASIEHVVGAEHDEVMGLPVSGRTDVFLVENKDVSPLLPGVVSIHPKRIAIEVKTVNGFAFKKQIGAGAGPAEGPRSGAIFQAALNGRALGADEVTVVILSMECLSDQALRSFVAKVGGEPRPDRKFVAEWTWPMADLDEMVDRELKRLAKIMEMVDARLAEPTEIAPLPPLPPRSIPLEMPARARVTDPSKGTWLLEVDGNAIQAGSTWMCGYCDYHDQCIADGPS